MRTCLTVGLTGGIASGKSTVQNAFAALGVPVLDADQVAREVVAPGSPALDAIAREFGADMLLADGSLDRRRMREHVFAEPQRLRRLEAITHPPIRARMRTWLSEQRAPYCVLSVAILLEARMHDLVDRVLVVDVPVAVQRERLRARDGIDDVLIERMLAAQSSREARLAAADDVLRNDGPLARTQQHVERLHRFYLGLAADGTPKAPGLRLPASVI
ncbi:dephospho-CoA kinase [Sinimarinibacterium thermocellulolyticum]|uniref:Dephospho-CoA kinase n=1 Tax=Sinimarinibacterium thermocellulolyticum TaxID=3170016 RepID=A0ABV2A9B2_9GAMM